MKLAELFIALGVKVDDKELRGVEGKINNVKKSALAMKVGLAAAVYGLNRLINGAIRSNAEFERFTKTTGLAIEKLQEWQEAGQKIDITLDKNSIANSIAGLQKNLDEIKFGRGDISTFQILGINIGGKDAFGVLEELRDKLQGLDSTSARNLIERTGLDASFLSLLRVSRQEFESLGKQFRLMANQRQGILNLGKSIKQLQLNFTALKNQLASALTPALTQFIQRINNFYSKNGKEIIKIIGVMGNAFSKVSQVIVGASKIIISILNGIYEGVKSILGMENAILLFGVVLAKIFSPAIFKPFNLAMVGLLLILEDISGWFEGKESLFGFLYEGIAKLVKTMQPLIDKVMELKKALSLESNVVNPNDAPEEVASKKIKGALGSLLSGGLKGATVGAGIGTVVPGLGTLAGAGSGFVAGALTEFFKDAMQNSKQDIINRAKYLEQKNNFSITINSENPKAVGDEIMNNEGFQKSLNAIGSQFENSTIY